MERQSSGWHIYLPRGGILFYSSDRLPSPRDRFLSHCIARLSLLQNPCRGDGTVLVSTNVSARRMTASKTTPRIKQLQCWGPTNLLPPEVASPWPDFLISYRLSIDEARQTSGQHHYLCQVSLARAALHVRPHCVSRTQRIVESSWVTGSILTSTSEETRQNVDSSRKLLSRWYFILDIDMEKHCDGAVLIMEQEIKTARGFCLMTG